MDTHKDRFISAGQSAEEFLSEAHILRKELEKQKSKASKFNIQSVE